MFLYKYSGPVKRFQLIVANNWEGYTYAVSEAKAKSNLSYRFKKQYGLTPNTKITLPGNIEMVEIPEHNNSSFVDGHQITIEEYMMYAR